MTFIEQALHIQVAAIAGAVVISALPAVLIIAIRARRERKAAYRIAQLDKIVVPHPTVALYQSINRMGGNRK